MNPGPSAPSVRLKLIGEPPAPQAATNSQLARIPEQTRPTKLQLTRRDTQDIDLVRAAAAEDHAHAEKESHLAQRILTM